MKLKVNSDTCIGCGACQAICPNCFEITDEGIATVKVKEIDKKDEEDAKDAKEGCPACAIEEVVEEDE